MKRLTYLPASFDGSRRVSCVDGDPACDADGQRDGICTFAARICVDLRHVPGCRPRRIADVHADARGYLRARPTVTLSPPPLPAAREQCGAMGSISVPVIRHRNRLRRSRARVRLVAVTNQERTDKDRATLSCVPNPVPCLANPAGGPAELDVTFAAGGALDLGATGAANGIVPASGVRIAVCLSGCDATSNPVCTAAGGPYGQALTAPLPLVAGETPACLVLRLGARGVHGTANAQTGAIDVVGDVTATITGGESGAICPRCSGAAPGDVGTCEGGGFPGSACVVDDVVTVPTSAGDDVYAVSRTCLPTGVPLAAVTVDLPLTTASSTLDATACPSSDGDVRRDGTAVVPSPAWPLPGYPKSASGALLAGTACAPATATAMDATLGLPGPAAVLVPVTESWLE